MKKTKAKSSKTTKTAVSALASKKTAVKTGANRYFRSTDGLISRRNQDGTIVLMRLADVSLFYKLEKLAASVWSELATPKSTEGLIQHFSELLPQYAPRLKKDIPALLEQFAKFKVVDILSKASGADAAFMTTEADVESGKYEIGSVRSFNLAQIENEILNESIYLDVFAGSDLRLKTDVTPIEGALSKVRSLEAINFKWDKKSARKIAPKARPSSGKQAGLIAQQVYEVMPELVRADRESGLLAVNYAKMNAYLVEAIKELSQKVDELQAQVDRQSKSKN